MSDYPQENAKGLWYNARTNRFEDDNGVIIHDLSDLFPTWQLDVWKKTKEYALLKDRKGELWDLFYDRIIPYCGCKHHCVVCSSKCEIYELVCSEYTLL
jgi:hypothetical protein